MLWNLLRNLFVGISFKGDAATQSKLDDREIAFNCPKCGQENRKTIGWLKANHSFTCAGCGAAATIQFKSRTI
jgi:transposase-like protein